MSLTNAPSPFVYWGQTSDSVTLLVDLKCCQNHELNLKEQSLSFQATGIGAHGRQQYGFEMHFYQEIITDESVLKISDREVEIILRKKMLILWPRLLSHAYKPGWLKVDFGRIKQTDYESSEEEEYQQPQSNRNVKDRHFGRGKRKSQDFKTTYLFMYNLFQFCGFLYLFIILLIHLLKEGPEESIKTIYSSISYLVKFLHLFQLLEIAHPLFGITKGSALLPAVQLFGRLFFIFGFVGRQSEIQHDVFTFYLLFVYSLAEVFRYPYYMLHVFRANIYAITWLRYSAWIVLYPLGFAAENFIIYKTIPLAEKSGFMTISMPNAWNFAFYSPGFMRFYLYFGTFFLFFYMTTHMYRQRSRVLFYSKTKIH